MRICAIGDSIMNGTCDPEALGWIGRAGPAGEAPRPAGHASTTSASAATPPPTSARRWRAEVEARRMAGVETALVFSFGINDSTRHAARRRRPRVATDSTARRTPRAMLGRGDRPIGRVLMVGPTPIADDAR